MQAALRENGHVDIIKGPEAVLLAVLEHASSIAFTKWFYIM